MAGRKDRQTLFYMTLLAAPGGLTTTTEVDWHLKVKDIEDDVDLTKNYCVTISIQKSAQFINSFLRYNRF